MAEKEATSDDRTLWEGVRRGDPRAFAAVYDRHHQAIYNYAFRRTGSWSHAEDITAVVFLEAWRHRAATTLEGESALPWLYGVTNNVVRHEFRSMARYQQMVDRLPRFDVEPDHAEEVVDRIHDEERMAQVLAAMHTLTDVEQETFALCVWSGLSYGEAAEAMQVPEGTVRSRLNRARTRLRAVDDRGRGDSGDGDDRDGDTTSTTGRNAP